MKDNQLLEKLADDILSENFISKESIILKTKICFDKYYNQLQNDNTKDNQLKNLRLDFLKLQRNLIDLKEERVDNIINQRLEHKIKLTTRNLEECKYKISKLKYEISNENKNYKLRMRKDENEIFINSLNRILRENFGKDYQIELCKQARIDTEEQLKNFHNR